jgi:Family of unknown function (DUF5302)
MAKDTDKTPTPQDEQRAKFEAALEAKKHKTGHGSAAQNSGGGSGAAHDHSSREGGKREFRRKSGG